jgi:hypothetical protein
MNAEKLFAICLELKRKFAETGLVQKIQNLAQATGSLAQQPQNGQFQQNVAGQRKNLENALSLHAFDELEPAWRQTVEELGGSILFGDAIKTQVNQLFMQERITPSSIVEGLNEIIHTIQPFQDSIDKLVTGFQGLKISADRLPPGECDIGITIPRTFVHNDLNDFSTELHKLDTIFGVFEELCTGTRDGFSIRTISSSDLTINLLSTPIVCACIAKTISWILDSYKKVLDIRLSLAKLRELGVPEENLKTVHEHATERVSADIEKAVEEIFVEYNVVQNAGRKNEVKNHLSQSMKRIAIRIDNGFSITIRASLPDKSNEEDDRAQEEVKKHFDVISDYAADLQYMKPEGEPILAFPRQEDVDISSDSDTSEVEPDDEQI